MHIYHNNYNNDNYQYYYYYYNNDNNKNDEGNLIQHDNNNNHNSHKKNTFYAAKTPNIKLHIFCCQPIAFPREEFIVERRILDVWQTTLTIIDKRTYS